MPEGVVAVPFLPSAKKVFEERRATIAKDDPEVLCEAAIDDPGAYSGSWSTSWNLLFKPGAELLVIFGRPRRLNIPPKHFHTSARLADELFVPRTRARLWLPSHTGFYRRASYSLCWGS